MEANQSSESELNNGSAEPNYHVEKLTPCMKQCTDVIEMVKELVAFYKMDSTTMRNTPEKLREAVEKDWVRGFITYNNNKEPIGYLTYFFPYSLWKGGRFLCLEDLYVREDNRKQGVGESMGLRFVHVAIEEKIATIQGTCMPWNTNACRLYKKFGAVDLHETEGWVVYGFGGDDIREVLETLGKPKK